MRRVDVEDVIQQLLPIAKLAGEVIMADYSRGVSEVQFKENDSPVTEADLAARVLASQLKPLNRPEFRAGLLV